MRTQMMDSMRPGETRIMKDNECDTKYSDSCNKILTSEHY
jgi:hypothetical protein